MSHRSQISNFPHFVNVHKANNIADDEKSEAKLAVWKDKSGQER
jgi:hypothetical protein